jgi:hypothetical protein
MLLMAIGDAELLRLLLLLAAAHNGVGMQH